jgi:hypothetical protein
LLVCCEDILKEKERSLFRQTSLLVLFKLFRVSCIVTSVVRCWICLPKWPTYSWRERARSLNCHLVVTKYCFCIFRKYEYMFLSSKKRSSRTGLPTLKLRLWKNLSRLSSSGQTSPVSEPHTTLWGITVV